MGAGWGGTVFICIKQVAPKEKRNLQVGRAIQAETLHLSCGNLPLWIKILFQTEGKCWKIYRNCGKNALFVAKLLRCKLQKDLLFFVNKDIIITKWREVGKSSEFRCAKGEHSPHVPARWEGTHGLPKGCSLRWCSNADRGIPAQPGYQRKGQLPGKAARGPGRKLYPLERFGR